MDNIFDFLISNFKKMFFSFVYLIIFVLNIIFCFFIYVYGEIRFLLSHFTYGTKKENKYYLEILKKAEKTHEKRNFSWW